jgi:hypothetical protein
VKKWGARKITHCKKEDFPDRLYAIDDFKENYENYIATWKKL